MVLIDGFNVLSGSIDSSAGTGFITLTPWDERTTPELQIDAIIQSINVQGQRLTDANVVAFNIPGIPGLGTVGGFDFRLQDYLSADLNTFVSYSGQLIAEANKDPRIAMAYTTYAPNYPMLEIEVDRKKAAALGITISELHSTIQAYFGSVYVNDFSKYGKVYKVFIQAEKNFRSEAADIEKLFVKNYKGNMVPLSTLVKVRFTTGPQNITHYNMYRSITINGNAAPGYSSGQAIAAMGEISSRVLPPNKTYGFDWSGMSYQELLAGNMTIYVFTFAIIAVYLFLCAQFESWVLPVMILLPVPLVMMGALVGQLLTGIENNLFAQVGLILLIGMSTKNAILIVEFCKEQRESGLSVIDSALSAARLRFRPIMMTIISFLLGTLPLALATGAGAMSMKSIGVVIVGGMIAATFVSTLLVPVIYVLLETLREKFVSVEEEVRNREMI